MPDSYSMEFTVSNQAPFDGLNYSKGAMSNQVRRQAVLGQNQSNYTPINVFPPAAKPRYGRELISRIERAAILAESQSPTEHWQAILLLCEMFKSGECANTARIREIVDSLGGPALMPNRITTILEKLNFKNEFSEGANVVDRERLQETVAALLVKLEGRSEESQFEASALELPVQAIAYLWEGLESESSRTVSLVTKLIKFLKERHLTKILPSVNSIYDGYNVLTSVSYLTSIRKQIFKEKILLTDSLSNEDLNIAYNVYYLPKNRTQAGYYKRYEERMMILESQRIKSEIRLIFALRLLETRVVADQPYAIEMLAQALREDGWKHQSHIFLEAIRHLKDVPLPQEIVDAHGSLLTGFR